MTRPTGYRAPVVITIAVLAAVVVNLVVYALGVAAGGSFVFSTPSGPARVDALTVAGFTAVPLAVGLTLTSVIARWWPGVFTLALIVAPLLAVGTVVVMTVPSDHDPVAKLALGSCHLTLVPVTLIALVAMRRRGDPGQARWLIRSRLPVGSRKAQSRTPYG